MVIDREGQISEIILKEGNVVFNVGCVFSNLILLLAPHHTVNNICVTLNDICSSFVPLPRSRVSMTSISLIFLCSETAFSKCSISLYKLDVNDLQILYSRFLPRPLPFQEDFYPARHTDGGREGGPTQDSSTSNVLYFLPAPDASPHKRIYYSGKPLKLIEDLIADNGTLAY